MITDLWLVEIENENTEAEWGEQVFQAPDQSTAIKWAQGWAGLNGWPKGTEWRCYRYVPCEVRTDLFGHAEVKLSAHQRMVASGYGGVS
jgi:hypothetical protein